VVKRNFTLVIMAIIVLSVLPGVVEYVRHRRGGTVRGGAGAQRP
jgi:membrane-associated protein